MNRLDIFSTLRSIVLRVTRIPECILENQNQPSPNGAYAAINPQKSIINRGQSKKNYTVHTEDDKSLNVSLLKQIFVTSTINFYGNDARTLANLLIECNKLPSISAILYGANIGWLGTGPVNDLTALQSARYENRASIDVNLWYEEEILDIVDRTASVCFSPEYLSSGELFTEEVVNDQP